MSNIIKDQIDNLLDELISDVGDTMDRQGNYISDQLIKIKRMLKYA